MLHGDTRVDDYFWLRERNNPEVRAYLQAENAYADAVMKPTEPLQETLYREILGRIQETDSSVPYRKGSSFYYQRTEQGKQFPIYCRKVGKLDAPEHVLLDLNALAELIKSPYLALGVFETSDDGNWLAYALDPMGFHEYTLRLQNMRTGVVAPEQVSHVQSAAWAADNRTVFYVIEDAAKRPYRLYRHTLGTDPLQDALIFEERDERFFLFISRSRSGDYLLITSQSKTTSEQHYLPARAPTASPTRIWPREAGREYYADHRGPLFYIRTNDRRRNFRLVTVPIKSPEHLKELVPHRDAVMLEGIDLFEGFLVRHEREDGLPQIVVTDLKTQQTDRLAFPEAAYTVFPAQNEQWRTSKLRFRYQSALTPPSVFDYDVKARTRELLKETPVPGGYDRAQYQQRRLFTRAADGTRIPITLVNRRGFEQNGRAPLLLKGYGAYGLPSHIIFRSEDISLLDRGFAIAVAHIRGGGELGKAWHDAGRMLAKKNTFSDFVAAAEFLIAEKYTSSEKLAITGASAGGLLMGAVVNMRPTLFRAVINHVPFVDVLNTMLDPSLPLTVTEFEEWGNPQEKQAYEYIRTYCPYTNLTAAPYPAMLVKTSWSDSQVMYWEPAKYVAKLRALKTDSNLLVLKVNMQAGHGGSSARYEHLKEIALDEAFLITQLGVTKPAAQAGLFR